MPDAFQISPRRIRRSLVAVLVAGTMLGGVASGAGAAYAQNAIQPSGMAVKLPDFVGLARQVKPAVVSITSTLKDDGAEDEGEGGGMGGGQQMPFPFPFPFQMGPRHGGGSRTVEARGSGFIISADGFVVTNNHVVKGATAVSVTLDDGTVLKAKVVGRDPNTDIALLKVKPSARLSFIQLGESDDVQPGEWVVAVGNPYGLGGSVTAGIVSARGRDIGDGPYDSFIQVDAPINRGNSGGPLFTQDGKVVGVNTAIISPNGGGSIGIGFAIPSDVVKNVVAQLQKSGHVVRGYLGVTAQEVSPGMAKALGLPQSDAGPAAGALVASVQSDSPAEKAGIKPGDVITALDGHRIANPRELAIKVAAVTPNNKVAVSYLRNGASQTADAVVANLAGREAGNDNGGGTGGSAGNTRSIGVSLAPLTGELRQQLGVDEDVQGVVVRAVRSGSPADAAGIHAGDVIVAVGNKPVGNPRDAVNAVRAALKKGDVALRVLHNGQMGFVAVSPDSSTAEGGGDPGGDNGATGGGDNGGDSGGDQPG